MSAPQGLQSIQKVCQQKTQLYFSYKLVININIQTGFWSSVICEIPAVPRKAFESADCDTMYTIYLLFCSQLADANGF